MADPEAAKDLVQRWRAGDEAAAGELHRRYAQRLWRLADRHMGQLLSRRVDPDDIVQSALGSFFRRTAQGEYSISHSGALWQLLVRITVNKARQQGERHRAAKRDVVIWK
jgi:DNA-directed RNA polymerase specialized sigma24 family protein